MHEPAFVRKVRDLPLISPKKIYDILERHGYRGQEYARKAVSLMAYRHVKRLKKIYMEKIDRKKLPHKFNYLFMGPTDAAKPIW